jgi:hypothetical protein
MRNILLVAGTLSCILAGCGGGGYGGGGGGSGGGMSCGGAYQPACPAPMVTLTAPVPGATVSSTVPLTATASASSTYGLTVTSVEFLIDGMAVGTVTSSPYTLMWNSTTVTKGSHSLTAKVTDSAGGTATTPAIMINTTGMAIAVAMTAAQIFPAPMSQASGMADLTVKLDTGATRGTVKLTGLSATAVTINEGFAGAAGPALIRLSPSGDNTAQWEVPANALLTAEQLTALSQGKLYVIATSAANPRGEIRGQIAPDNVAVTFSTMAPAAEARSVSLAAGGVVATTVDKSAYTLSIQVNSTGVDDADAAEVDSAATGRKLAVLSKDSVEMGHWSTELAPISAADVGHFESGKWYVSIATAVEAGGALRGPIRAPGD